MEEEGGREEGREEGRVTAEREREREKMKNGKCGAKKKGKGKKTFVFSRVSRPRPPLRSARRHYVSLIKGTMRLLR